jgi:hypothetical protein
MTRSVEPYVHITTLNESALIRAGASAAIPPLFTAEIDDPAQPYSLELRVRTVQGRKPEVIELLLAARGDDVESRITTEGLRGVHLAKALDLALSKALRVDESDAPKSSPDARRPKRGVAVSDEFLQRVADIYRSAVAGGSRSPVNEVALQLGSSRSTAGRWVVQARRANILRAAMGTRAGESTEPRSHSKKRSVSSTGS